MVNRKITMCRCAHYKGNALSLLKELWPMDIRFFNTKYFFATPPKYCEGFE
jgi:hypothetical protein